MNTFPTLDRSPDIEGFADEYSGECVQIASTASGYPVLNDMFTFDARTWTYTLSYVSQTDKSILMSFYQSNKSVPFYWLNEQDNTVYEVVFIQKPTCRMQDNDNNELWEIGLVLRQSAATELPATAITQKFYGGDAMIEVVNLAAGADISDMPVFVAAQGMVLTTCHLLTKGTPAGIDNSNTVVVTIEDSAAHTVVTKTFNTGTQPPTEDSEDWSSLLDDDYTALSEGDVLFLTVMQGTTANMPAFSIVFGGYYS